MGTISVDRCLPEAQVRALFMSQCLHTSGECTRIVSHSGFVLAVYLYTPLTLSLLHTKTLLRVCDFSSLLHNQDASAKDLEKLITGKVSSNMLLVRSQRCRFI